MVHIWLCQVHVTLCVCVKTSMMISLSPLSSLSLSLSLSLCHAGIVLMQRLVDVVMNFVTSNTLLSTGTSNLYCSICTRPLIKQRLEIDIEVKILITMFNKLTARIYIFSL